MGRKRKVQGLCRDLYINRCIVIIIVSFNYRPVISKEFETYGGKNSYIFSFKLFSYSVIDASFYF